MYVYPIAKKWAPMVLVFYVNKSFFSKLHCLLKLWLADITTKGRDNIFATAGHSNADRFCGRSSYGRQNLDIPTLAPR